MAKQLRNLAVWWDVRYYGTLPLFFMAGGELSTSIKTGDVAYIAVNTCGLLTALFITFLADWKTVDDRYNRRFDTDD